MNSSPISSNYLKTLQCDLGLSMWTESQYCHQFLNNDGVLRASYSVASFRVSLIMVCSCYGSVSASNSMNVQYFPNDFIIWNFFKAGFDFIYSQKISES